MVPRTAACLALGTAALLLTPLPGQERDTLRTTPPATADSLARPPDSWVRPLVIPLPDAPRPFRLHLPWDEWGHSDLTASMANPFVTADLQVGAARLDGSLGQPVLSHIIPSAALETESPPSAILFGWDPSAELPEPEVLSFISVPLADTARSAQTYFIWDQGDFDFSDVQIGGTTEIDAQRNLLLAGHARRHRGRYDLSGPNPSRPYGNALQNYLLDYRRQLSPGLSFSYTLLHQQEQTGLPQFGESSADRRQNQTFSHGFRLSGTYHSWAGELYGSAMVNELLITTDAIQGYRLHRRGLSQWAGAGLDYRLSPNLRLTGRWQLKTRRILDWDLGSYRLSLSLGRLGFTLTQPQTTWYGGLALENGRPVPEAALSWLRPGGYLSIGTEAAPFLDYPHLNRRTTGDTTLWLPGPVALRRTTLAGRLEGIKGYLEARLAHLTTGDGRVAATGGLAFEWTPIREVLYFRGTLTGTLSADSLVFPNRFNGFLGSRFTLPLERRRARPFIGIYATGVHNQFARWLDPRFADPEIFISAGTVSTSGWLTVEAGLKAVDFELRYSRYNLTGTTIENSPYYLASSPLSHYSLTWRFWPQKAGKKARAEDY